LLICKREISVNLIEKRKIPRSNSLFTVIPDLEVRATGVVGLILGRDHIKPLAQYSLFQLFTFNLLFRYKLTTRLRNTKKTIPVFKAVGLDLNLVQENRAKDKNAPASIAGAIRILILAIKEKSSSDLKIACSFLLKLVIPM